MRSAFHFLLTFELAALTGLTALHAQPPTALDDSYATAEDRRLAVPAAVGLLSNDKPSGHQAPAAAVVLGPVHGQLDLNPRGSFVYVPSGNYFGPDQFSYRLYGDRQPLSFTIDRADSAVKLAATLRVETAGFPSISTDADTSHVGGTVTLELAPTNAPFALARITDLQAVLTDAIKLQLGIGCIPFLGCLAGVQIDTAANDLRLATTLAGPVVAVAANGTFEQDGNLLGVTGNLTLKGTGQFTNLLPEISVPLNLPAVPAAWNGRMTAAGDELVLELPLNYHGSLSWLTNGTLSVDLTGTIRARAPARLPPVEESSPANVVLEIVPVNDAPIAAPDAYLVRAGTALIVPAVGTVSTQTLVAAGATWKYLYNGVDQGVAWRALNFDDSNWLSGRAELGYGDGGFLGNNRPEVTNIRPLGAPVRPSAYFRKEFFVTNAVETRILMAEILRDDGAALYLNGVEIARENLPADAAYSTLAVAAVSGSDEVRFFPETVDPARLLEGRNVLAVEVHQASLNESLLNPADLSFDLRLWRQIGLSGLLANDTDVDSTRFTASLASPPAHGAVTLNFDGSFTYASNPGYSGPDEFLYGLSDGGTNDAEVVLVRRGSVWRYQDDGSDLGTAWRDPGFNDAGWQSGAAELGYGDDNSDDDRPETTVIDSGPIGGYHTTTYFRHAFASSVPLAFLRGLRLHLLRDDGAAVYLNGIEVVRDNLPPGANYLTGATLPIEGSAEARFTEFAVPAQLLVEGQNVLAVELHQNQFISDDASFDLELMASATPGGHVGLSVALDDLDLDGMSDAWELAQGLDPTRPDGEEDPDQDGATNREEFQAGTDPHNPGSSMRVVEGSLSPSAAVLWVSSVAGYHYVLQDSPDLASWSNATPRLTATGPVLEVRVPFSSGVRSAFYRVKLDN